MITAGVAIGALALQTIVFVVGGVWAFGRLAARLEVKITEVSGRAIDRAALESTVDRASAGWEARCERHEKRCEEDRQRLHDQLSAMAKRVNG